ncbi:MAG TPA: sugar transferase [Acidimicrobiales bacterium]|nr:sugar transferase [Acidimicrobiales bacterium]
MDVEPVASAAPAPVDLGELTAGGGAPLGILADAEPQASLAPLPSGAGLGRIGADALALAVAAVAAAALPVALERYGQGATEKSLFSTTLVHLLVTVPVITAFLAPSRGRWSLCSTLGHNLFSVFSGLAAGGLVSMAAWRVIAALGLARPPQPDALLLLCGIGVAVVTVGRTAHHAPPRRHGRRARRVLIVGSGLVANRLTNELSGAQGVEVIGCVDDDPIDSQSCIGKLDDVERLYDAGDVDHVVVAFTKASSETIIEALRPVQGRVPITVVPRLFDVLPNSADLHYIGAGLTGISVAPAALGWGSRGVKRTMDVAGAVVALVILSPLLLAVALAVKLTSRGPALFRQERVGYQGTSFEMLKFRSMYTRAADKAVQVGGEVVVGPFPKLKNDSRVTPIGRLIRRLSVDELPQLINVLKGEMSLVGPRPFIPDDNIWIGGWAQRRYVVRPGITGLWQVSGRNDLTFEEMCRLDTIYVGSWSLGLDLHIVLRTLRAVLVRHGAY